MCAEGFITVELDKLGFRFTDAATSAKMIRCEACPTNEYKGPAIKSIWQCEACPDPAMIYTSGNTCECGEGYIRGGDSCVTVEQRTELIGDGFIENSLEFKVEYNNVKQLDRDGSQTIAQYSDVFDYFYLQSAVGCRFNDDQRMCQVLANLCVLQLYNEKTLACKLVRDLQKLQTTPSIQEPFYEDEGWRLGLPWLYYSQTPQAVFKDAEPVELVVSFSDSGTDDSRTNKLKFWLARYSMEGEFLGFQELYNDLSSCPMDREDVDEMTQFGVVSENECYFELFDLT